jgi:cytochrome c oxidase subunit 1/cytochrome c oxidase subunit I+III
LLVRTRVEESASSVEARLHAVWEEPKTLHGWLGSVDHKKIGLRYLVTAFAFLTAGGIEAVLMRLQLIGPELRLLSPEAYNQVFSLHGITMIFWYAAPILSGFGNYLVPLFIGARDMAFPRLNAFSYWAFLFSGLFLYASVPFGLAPDTGWFAYVPLSNARYAPGLNLDFYALALIFLTISTTVGAVNFIATILRLRAPGMAVQRMPLFLYSTLTTSFLIVVSLPALTAACVFLELDRRWGTHFFDASLGGDPLLWQHAFWFFGHPWVYVIFLPATGMISMLLPVLSRRPIVGYPFVAFSTVLTGVVGMGVWVHHMFAVGMSPLAMGFFSAASMTISLFSTVQVFAWVATLWAGTPVRTTALLFALGFIAIFVMGGLSGVATAVIPLDWQVTDTYFVVAHLHYVLIGANLFPVFAGFYYWLPKMTGRMLDERLGRWSFWIMFAGFNVGFFPMHLSGLLGMPRRVYTYAAADGLGALNLVTTLGALTLGAGVLLSVINLLVSLRRGPRAGANPWSADTLEWAMPSPPPAYAFVHLPRVTSRHPLWTEPDPRDDPNDARVLAGDRYTLTTTSVDANVRGVAVMPKESLAPLLLAAAFAFLFSALLLKALALAAAGALACAAVAAVWIWPEAREVPA